MDGDYLKFEKSSLTMTIEKYILGERVNIIEKKIGEYPKYSDFLGVTNPEELIIGKFLEENNFIHCELMECGNL